MANRFEYAPRPPSYSSNSGGGSLADIILRGGDIQAQAHLARGQIMGDAVRGLGQTIGGAIQAHGEQMELAKRDAAWISFLEQTDDNGQPVWMDPKVAALGITKIFGPGEEGQAQLRALGGVIQLGQGKRNPEADQKALMDIGDGMSRVGEPGRALLYPRAYKLLQSAMPEVAAKLSPEYSPEQWKEIAPYFSRTDAGKPIEVSQNARLWDPATKQVLLDVAPPEPKTPQVGSFEDYLIQKFGERPTPDQIAQARREYAQADNAPGANGPRPLTQTAEAALIARWAKDYDTAAKPARDLDRALSMMDAGLKSAKAGDLNAGSQAVLVTFQKLLDPTSVVRESEYARSAEGMALLKRIEGAYQRLTRGGPGVPVDELEQFARVGRQFVDGYSKHAEGVKSRIGKAADRYNIPHELIFSDYGSGAESAGGGPVRVNSPEEAARLPKGTKILLPDGSTGTVR